MLSYGFWIHQGLRESLAVQSNSASLQVRFIASVLYKMRLSFSHLVSFMLPKLFHFIRNKLPSLSCLLWLFYVFITGISYFLGNKWAFYIQNGLQCSCWFYRSQLITKVISLQHLQLATEKTSYISVHR